MEGKNLLKKKKKLGKTIDKNMMKVIFSQFLQILVIYFIVSYATEYFLIVSHNIILKFITKNIKENTLNIFRCRHDENFKSQTSLHHFKLETKKPLMHLIGQATVPHQLEKHIQQRRHSGSPAQWTLLNACWVSQFKKKKILAVALPNDTITP